MDDLREIALFAGAGGGILGGKLLGWNTVAAVEFAPFCARRLMQRQNEGHLPPFPIWDDVRTFDGRPWNGIVDVVSGGFPCQDISAAGKGAGISGERSGLWVEMARIIHEVEPQWVLVENSPLLVSRGLGTVLGDLAQMGYHAEWGVLGADDAGAPHKRDRIWIVGRHNASDALGVGSSTRRTTDNKPQRTDWACGSGEQLAHTDKMYVQGHKRSFPHTEDWSFPRERQIGPQGPTHNDQGWWEKDPGDGIEPELGRVAHGMASRVDRLKAIGNGQVPATAAMAFRFLSNHFPHEVTQ